MAHCRHLLLCLRTKNTRSCGKPDWISGQTYVAIHPNLWYANYLYLGVADLSSMTLLSQLHGCILQCNSVVNIFQRELPPLVGSKRSGTTIRILTLAFFRNILKGRLNQKEPLSYSRLQIREKEGND
jgi:hypothetical protein